MRLIGAASVSAAPMLEEVAEALHLGHPAFLWSDGQDVTVLIGDNADESDALVKMARRGVPEFA